MKKIVIIGGVAVGATLAAKLRRNDEECEIIIFEKTGYISYANCGLPYYISKTIDKKEKLILQKKENFEKRYKLKVHISTEVNKVDFDKKVVIGINEKKEEIFESYDKLVIATGTSSIELPFLKNHNNVFPLKTVEHTLKIDSYIKENKIKNVIVLGSGFIGIEAAENFNKLGLNTTVVEAAPQILAPFDQEMAKYGEKALEKNGVKVKLNSMATDFDGEKLYLKNGEKIEADLILSSVGVKTNTNFLRETNLEMDERGFISVNNKFETNIKDVYAAGDIIKPFNKLTSSNSPLQLANPANRQAVVLANILSGSEETYNPVIGTSIVHAIDMTLAQTGLNEKKLKELELNYKVIRAHINNHAGYYPGAGLINYKVMINPDTGMIYGAQATGEVHGVDKRIDLLSMAIKFNIPVQSLVDMETTYAPQYGSAKDPIVMIGYIGKNIVENKIDTIQYQDIKVEDKILFVLENDELKDVNLKNIINIPLNELRERLDELDKQTNYIICCKSGMRAHLANNILRNNNYKSSNLAGGYISLNQAIETFGEK